MRITHKIDVDIKDISRVTKGDAYKGLVEAANYLLVESNKTVPFDTGLLESTGRTSGDINIMTTAVSYDTPYAERVHEHPEYRFKNGRRGKWLENTIDEQKRELEKIVAKALSDAINKGGGI